MIQRGIFLFCISGLLALVLWSGCKKDEQQEPDNQIPVVPVSISLNPNSTEYIRLNVVSGWENIYGGYRGIIVYRQSINEFVAFERCCPYDWNLTTTKIVVDTSGLTISCPNCKSQYLILDGSPYQGPSHYPLKQYQTSYSGEVLYIFN